MFDFGDPCVEGSHVGDAHVGIGGDVGPFRRRLFSPLRSCLGYFGGLNLKHVRDAFGQRAEFHLCQKAKQDLGLGIANFKVIQCEFQRRVGVEQDELF